MSPLLPRLVRSSIWLALLAVPALRPAQVVETSLPLARFGSSGFGYASYSGIGESLRVVIRDEASWRGYWRRVHATMQPMPPLPAVDFSQEMVVLAALGARRTGGFGIRIDSAYDGGEAVTILVRRAAPGGQCLVTSALTQPIDLARIPSRKSRVRFRERDEVEAC